MPEHGSFRELPRRKGVSAAVIVASSKFRVDGEVPGDKSLSHRALILSALAEGTTRLVGHSLGEDVASTRRCLQALGVSLTDQEGEMRVEGVGLAGLRPPAAPLPCGNSGTTMRLLAGVVAGARLAAVLDGDESLRRRPMSRVLDPLRALGARGRGQGNSPFETAPLVFDTGGEVTGKSHVLEVASAQVKSALLLAGLWGHGPTRVREPLPSRDHTERMLPLFGVSIDRISPVETVLQGPVFRLISPRTLSIPGDPSSAAFLLGAASLIPESRAVVRGVNVNPNRSGFLEMIREMGARLTVLPEADRCGEPSATLMVEGGPPLRAVYVGPSRIPSLVDEIPLLAVLATQARGRTVIEGAGELRLKESDRLAETARGLQRMGAQVEETRDGLIIDGPTSLAGTVVDSAGDHRLAMSFAVAGLVATGTTKVVGSQWAAVSFPEFFPLLVRGTSGAVTMFP